MSSLCPGDYAVTPWAPKRAAGGGGCSSKPRDETTTTNMNVQTSNLNSVWNSCRFVSVSCTHETAIHHHDYCEPSYPHRKHAASVPFYSVNSSAAVARYSQRMVQRRLKPSHDGVVFTPECSMSKKREFS
jgi:hypothetical protein